MKIKTFTDKNSIMYQLRLNRFNILLTFLSQIRKETNKEVLKILDVGGTLEYWETFDYTNKDDIDIVNFKVNETSPYLNISLIEGDATNMHYFVDNAYDVVFSNSVIEHLYTYSQQEKMCKEIMRVAKYLFVQTPNYYFPYEPHYRTLFFQMFPKSLKLYLIRNFDVRGKTKLEKPLDKESAVNIANRIRLLKRKELKRLFPNYIIVEEKYFGLVKSFMIHSKI